MIRLALRTAAARFRAAPALTALTVVAIALGSAAVLSVQLLNRASLAALDASLEAVSPGADLRLEAVTTGEGMLPDEAWLHALALPGVESASPIVRLRRVAVSAGEASLEVPLEIPLEIPVVGVDLMSAGFAFAAAPGEAATAFSADSFLTGGVTLPRSAADRLGVVPGEEVRLDHRGRIRSVPVAGIHGTADGEETAGEAAFLDLAWAQALRGAPGLDRIEIAIRGGADAAAVADGLETAIPGARATSGAALREEGADLFAAFRLTLTALSTVSLLVGAFLVYASVRAGLAARRREIGLYRSLGAPVRSVGGLLAAEVALTALVGGGIGVPLGAVAAGLSLGRVESVLTSFYLLDRIGQVSVTPGVALASVGLALGAALLGALPEIVSAARRPPAALLAPGRSVALRLRKSSRRWPTWVGAALAVFGISALAPESWPWLPASLGGGFAAAGAVLLGAAILCRPALALLSRLSARLEGRSPFARGLRAAVREPGATAPPATALLIAVAMLVGVSSMIASFRTTLEVWLDETLVADLYVARPGRFGEPGGVPLPLAPESVEILAGDPAVAHHDTLRALRVRLDGRLTSVAGVRTEIPGAGERFSFLGDRDAALAGLLRGDALVSEPLARRLELSPGATLLLPTPGGAAPVRVAGIYRDYGNEGGGVILDRARVNALFPTPGPPPVHGVALTLRPEAEPAAVAAGLRERLPVTLDIVENDALRARALVIFDETMAVTGLLRRFALFIAALGVALLLWALARERAAETALLRALGASRAQAAGEFFGRGAVVSLVALGLGGAAGAALSALLALVVNPAWFGWTVDLHWPIGAFAGQAAVVLVAGLLAAALPARLAARVSATSLVREL